MDIILLIYLEGRAALALDTYLACILVLTLPILNLEHLLVYELWLVLR